jgi:hypothetical protein
MKQKWMSSLYPDYMINEAERLSTLLGINRSDLLRNALNSYLIKHSSFPHSLKIRLKNSSTLKKFGAVLNRLSKSEIKISISWRW